MEILKLMVWDITGKLFMQIGCTMVQMMHGLDLTRLKPKLNLIKDIFKILKSNKCKPFYHLHIYFSSVSH